MVVAWNRSVKGVQAKIRAEFNKGVTDYTAGRAEVVKLVADMLTMVNGTYPRTSAALAVGSTPAQVATGAFVFQINGMPEAKAAVAAGTAFTATTHDITDGSANSYLLSIAAGGTITITMGTEAVGTVPGAAPVCPANEAAIGLVTIAVSGAAFDATSDDLTDGHITDTYTNYTADSNFAGEDAITAAAPAAVTQAAVTLP